MKIKHNFIKSTFHTTASRWFYGMTPTGEQIIVNISDCSTGFKYRRDAGWFWRFNKQIKVERGATSYKYKSVQTYTEKNGVNVCLGLYNPTHNGQQINHIYDKASDEVILSAVWKLANKHKALLTDENAHTFDDLSDKHGAKYNALVKRARVLFRTLHENHTHLNRDTFDREACFISSSEPNGFYFPNINTNLRCIAFKNGRAVALYNDPHADGLSVLDFKQLRHEITLNSLFVKDYQNTLGIDPQKVCNFCEGWLEYEMQLYKEQHPKATPQERDRYFYWLLDCVNVERLMFRYYKSLDFDPLEIGEGC